MIKEFTVGTSHTINLGNYESTKVEASITVTVPESAALATEPQTPVDEEQRSWLKAAQNEWTLLKDSAQKDLRALLEETFRAQSRKSSKAVDK